MKPLPAGAAALILPLILVASPVRADTFYGHDCKGACTDQQAGYDWALRQGITRAEDCEGSDGFADGCRAYLENKDAQADAGKNGAAAPVQDERADTGMQPDESTEEPDGPVSDEENYQDSAQGGTDLDGDNGADSGEDADRPEAEKPPAMEAAPVAPPSHEAPVP
jgi:hypothetical protein